MLGRDAETRIIEGSPGIALCELANDLSADAIVLGTPTRFGAATSELRARR